MFDRELERLTKKKKDAEEHRMNQSAAYEERRGLINHMEQQVDEMLKNFELAKEQLTFQKAERVRLELSLKKVAMEVVFNLILDQERARHVPARDERKR
jgi:hypothetical protein